MPRLPLSLPVAGLLACRTLRRGGVLALVAGVGLGTAIGLGAMLDRSETRPTRAAAHREAPLGLAHSSRYLLNALLLPALDPEAIPLRWVDPRPALRCGPDTTVSAEGNPLPSGTLVPDTPFALEWRMDGCWPYGDAGPRFDGSVRLIVYRENWGFSAIVEPSSLRVSWPGREPFLIAHGGAWTAQVVDDDPLELADLLADRWLQP